MNSERLRVGDLIRQAIPESDFQTSVALRMQLVLDGDLVRLDV
jgi:hypothetical protein